MQSSNANGIKNKYLQLAQNNQAGTSQYINSQKTTALNQMNSLLQSKYGTGATYNPNTMWSDYGNAVNGYDANMENENYARYQALKSQLDNYDTANQLYGQATQNLNTQQAVNSLDYDRAKLYGEAALKAKGISNGGLAETSNVGLANNYLNANNQAYSNYSSNINQLYSDLASANRETNANLESEIASIREARRAQDLANYGVEDANSGININNIESSMFAFDKNNKSLNAFNQIKQQLINGEISNGTIIALGDGHRYLVYDGYLYPTSNKASQGYTWKEIRKSANVKTSNASSESKSLLSETESIRKKQQTSQTLNSNELTKEINALRNFLNPEYSKKSKSYKQTLEEQAKRNTRIKQ